MNVTEDAGVYTEEGIVELKKMLEAGNVGWTQVQTVGKTGNPFFGIAGKLVLQTWCESRSHDLDRIREIHVDVLYDHDHTALDSRSHWRSLHSSLWQGGTVPDLASLGDQEHGGGTIILCLPRRRHVEPFLLQVRPLPSFYSNMTLNLPCSYTYDLTHTLQYNLTRPVPDPAKPGDAFATFNDKWLWNRHLLNPGFHSNVGKSAWVLPMIHGFINQTSELSSVLFEIFC